MRAERTHLYPYRTQKLSVPAAIIADRASVKVAHGRLFRLKQLSLFIFSFPSFFFDFMVRCFREMYHTLFPAWNIDTSTLICIRFHLIFHMKIAFSPYLSHNLVI